MFVRVGVGENITCQAVLLQLCLQLNTHRFFLQANIILCKCSFLRNITVMYSNVPVAHNTHVNHRRPEDTHVSSSIPQMGRHIPPSNSHLMKAWIGQTGSTANLILFKQKWEHPPPHLLGHHLIKRFVPSILWLELPTPPDKDCHVTNHNSILQGRGERWGISGGANQMRVSWTSGRRDVQSDWNPKLSHQVQSHIILLRSWT